MASSPMFIGTVKSPSVAISTANALRDGTGTLGTVHTAGANGARIDKINITATVTTTAGMIRLFAGPTGQFLIAEIPVFANTVSATNPAWSSSIVFEQGLMLQATYILKAGTEKAENFNVTVVNGGDI